MAAMVARTQSLGQNAEMNGMIAADCSKKDLKNTGPTVARQLNAFGVSSVWSLLLLCGSAFGVNPAALGQSSGASGTQGNVLMGDQPAPGQSPVTDIRPADVVKWSADTARMQADGSAEVGIRLTTTQDFTLYADKIRFVGPLGFALTSLTTPPTELIVDPITGKEVESIRGGEFVVRFKGPTGYAQPVFPIEITYIACTKVICLFPHTERLAPSAFMVGGDAPIAKQDGATITVPTGNEIPPPAIPAAVDEDFESRWARELSSGAFSFAGILVAAFVGGLLTNLTPCVAPMIPITMRLLSGHTTAPIIGASLYAGGILVTYTALGMFAAMSGGMFGSLMASPTFNVVFSGVMILLGMSMLGFGDFSRLQAIGSRIGSGAPSRFNTFLMGAGAGLVAAPCTGPILAALLAYTAKSQNVGQSSFLLMTYSLGFALPYVFLGGASAKVKKVKVSFRVQVAVKLVFAAVMFALGLYYLRIPAYQYLNKMSSAWPVIASSGLAVGAVLTVIWIILPALQNNKKLMIFPSAILAVGIFGATQWATSKNPEAASALNWHKTESAAFAAARDSGKPILVDAWAEWCEACKKMDVTTFADPAVIRLLAAEWTLLKLDLTESNDANDALQEKYGLQSLPTLTLVPANGDLTKKVNIQGYVSAGTLIARIAEFQKNSGKSE